MVTDMASSGKILNIEVGDRLTKVCVSIQKGKTYQIRNSFMFLTPEGAVSDGQISTTDALAGRLAGELRERGLGDIKNAVFALTSGKVATREVMLPPVKDSRLKDVVRTNAADYFPVDLTKYHVTYAMLERIDKGEDSGCRVLVYAAPLQLLEPYFILAGKAGLTVKAVDFSGNSQFQALRSISSEAVTMYVNVDCTNSCVTFIGGGKFLMQRAFTFGGDELIMSYLNSVGETTGSFLSALRECSADEPQFLKDGVMAPSDVTEGLSRLVGNIIRSSDYFNSNHWDQLVERVVLTGPCSRLVGLREMVANGTGLDTSYLDDIPDIDAFANSTESASFYISCIGSSIAPLDMIPPQFRVDKKKQRKLKGRSENAQIRDGLIICFLCLAAALALSFISISGYRQALSDKEAVEKQISDLAYVKDVYSAYVQYKAGAGALLQLDASIDSPNDQLTAFLNELEEKMPSDILLLSASCTRESAVMNVTVPDYSDIAVVLVQLRSFESLSDVKLGSAVEQTDEFGASFILFSLNCTYGANPYLTGANPYAAQEQAAAASAAASAPAPAAEPSEG